MIDYRNEDGKLDGSTLITPVAKSNATLPDQALEPKTLTKTYDQVCTPPNSVINLLTPPSVHVSELDNSDEDGECIKLMEPYFGHFVHNGRKVIVLSPNSVGNESPTRLPKLPKIPKSNQNLIVITNTGSVLNGNSWWQGEMNHVDFYNLHRVGWFNF